MVYALPFHVFYLFCKHSEDSSPGAAYSAQPTQTFVQAAGRGFPQITRGKHDRNL